MFPQVMEQLVRPGVFHGPAGPVVALAPARAVLLKAEAQLHPKGSKPTAGTRDLQDSHLYGQNSAFNVFAIEQELRFCIKPFLGVGVTATAPVSAQLYFKSSSCLTQHRVRAIMCSWCIFSFRTSPHLWLEPV